MSTDVCHVDFLQLRVNLLTSISNTSLRFSYSWFLSLQPINAHSHLLAMLLGSSEAIPIHKGKIVLGQWQSVMLVDLDGPRDRTVGLQVTGFKNN